VNEAELPTWPEIKGRALRHLYTARTEMSEARDWLNSDWRPLGSPLPGEQGEARNEALRLIRQAKALIDQAKDVLGG
jgi:hypothetical protein